MFKKFLCTTDGQSWREMLNPKPTVYEAARDGAAVELSNVLQKMTIGERRTALERKTKDGDQLITPLIISARNGNLESVKILFRYKADIEARGTVKVDNEVIEGCTPLWVAAATGHLDVVKLLIKQNADVDGRTLTNSTPLRAAAYVGRLDIVSCLVENGADVNARNSYENTPLMVACYHGHMNMVNYLIKRGAHMDLQEKNGNTALHYAVEKGHLEIVRELLALGASQMPNTQRLTPLLLASNECKIEIVEYFIKRPECTKEQRIEGLELLGGTIANNPDVYDIEKAFSYMKRGMEERFEKPSCPLLKQEMEAIEVYQSRKESQNLQELSLIEGNHHSIHMEGLIIRERILGTDNTKLIFPIRYRGAVFADSENFDPCIGLWRYAMEIGHRCNQPITYDLKGFADILCHMVHRNSLPKQRYIEEVFETAICEYERLTEKVQSKKLKGEHQAKLLKEELEDLVYCALYLLTIFAKIQDTKSKQSFRVYDLIERFLHLNPRTHEGNTLLHLAVWSKTPIQKWYMYVRHVCKFPCVETMKLIINAGGDVNVVNNKGNTPLHLAVDFKPNTGGLLVLREVLEGLFDGGVHDDLVNNVGKTAMDVAETDEARRILLVKSKLQLKCIAARAVRKFGLSYFGVPKTVEKFISLH